MKELPSTKAEAKRWYISEDSAGFHWWPLPVALFAVGTLLYSGAFSYHEGWLDEFTGNLTRIQFNDPDVLQGGCMAINHKMTWRELRNKASKCSRGQFYDPLHNDCYQCSSPVAEDRIFALHWDASTECRNLLLQPDVRFATHIMWSAATLDPATGAIVKPAIPDASTRISRCMLEMRSRCIQQIAVIGGPSTSFASVLTSDAKIDAFVASVVAHVTKSKFDGVHIVDVGGNDKSNSGDWKTNYSPTAVKYMAALRKALDAAAVDAPRLTLSWEELASAFDTTSKTYNGCKSASDASGTYRCFNPDIAGSVDFVSLELFGRHASVSLPSLMLAKPWAGALPSNKIVFNTCTAPSPLCRGSVNGKDELAIAAKTGSDAFKGVSIASATADIEAHRGASISAMGPLGAYGVLMPQRAPQQPSAAR
ncbi:hypothetical protein SPRG_07776 [Saprolegnia parasitica CBS 223.65]|uniref:Uncharacterized protein n=1 Tax=Saprolegnia parasitica (strain CBS 223.65) TaxID=695850 RepID=A0A067CD05_SAPPC|nr:hypothetical protein SPRG_07776 [Saprolegnia parasitica CBS 223.65]KDO27065.1 hypothetical protein SPRG_07776 [Saprolegnia parasitica CBS 223.65]|eukprot:XP_012202160.1 hypothetical protein SPRG_07776 [Saprolegnia parasitica CBS 223.65]